MSGRFWRHNRLRCSRLWRQNRRKVIVSSSTEAAPDRLAGLLAEHAELEAALADPAVHTDQSRARRLGRRYAQLAPVVETARALEAARNDLTAARELATEDASFAAED